MRYHTRIWWCRTAVGRIHVLYLAPEQDAPLNLKLFKLRSQGRETLVHDAVVQGCRVVACDVEPGAQYRLYGYSSQAGPMQPMDVTLPQPRQWAAGAATWPCDDPLPATEHPIEQLATQLHLMLRADRVQRCPRFDQLRSGERFTPVFNPGHLPGASQLGCGAQRFMGLLRLEGSSGPQRLQELAQALETRADVAYCSLDPVRAPWSSLSLANLVTRIRPGAVLAMPWRFPLADSGCAPIAHSRVIWDIQRACFETDATVFYPGKPGDAALPRWGETGAVPVQGTGCETIEALAQQVAQAQRRFSLRFPGSYLPPSMVRDCFDRDGAAGAQGLATLQAAVSGADAIGG